MLKFSGHLYLFNLLIITKNLRNLLRVMTYGPLMGFYGFWFQDKGYESAVTRELNPIDMNTRDIVIVQIHFRIVINSFFTSEGRG